MRSTFSRTFTAITVLLLAALVIIGVSFQLLVNNFLGRSAMADLRQDGQVLVQLVQAYGDETPLSERDFGIAFKVGASVSNSDAVICDAKGKLLFCAADPLGCQHIGMVLNQDFLEKTFASGGLTDTGVITGLYADERYLVSLPVYTDGGARLGVVLVSSPIGSTQMVMNRITDIFIFVSILVVAICLLVMTVFLRQQSTPLKEVARAASAFGHGDLTARVKTGANRSQEVEEMALAFNNMAASLQKSEYQRQEFVANVSHELKTPMTTIAGFVDGILDGTIPPEKQNQYLRLVSDETKRLNRLVRSMLDISRLQELGGVPAEQKSRFDVSEAAGQVLITFEQKITDKALQVEVQMPEHPVFTMAHPDFITQVIYNLVDNAVKFCPQGGDLMLRIRTGGSKAYVSVANSGNPIPPQELPLVFDRFHKTDKSRSLNRDSWGLGLHIVKTIVGAHGENISVTSNEDMTTFTFTLPLVN